MTALAVAALPATAPAEVVGTHVVAPHEVTPHVVASPAPAPAAPPVPPMAAKPDQGTPRPVAPAPAASGTSSRDESFQGGANACPNGGNCPPPPRLPFEPPEPPHLEPQDLPPLPQTSPEDRPGPASQIIGHLLCPYYTAILDGLRGEAAVLAASGYGPAGLIAGYGDEISSLSGLVAANCITTRDP